MIRAKTNSIYIAIVIKNIPATYIINIAVTVIINTVSGNLYRAILNLKKYNCDSCNFSVDVNNTPVTCKNADDGQAALTLSTGIFSDYNIVWSNALTFSTLQDLTPGFYTATVTDTLTGCSRFVTTAFHNPDSITISSINTTASVGGNPGNIIVTAAAANETLLYSLDGINYQPTATLSVPANGNYTVYVKNKTLPLDY